MGCVSSKKKLSKADLEFLEENTEFTKDQIVEWYEGFIVSEQNRTEPFSAPIFFLLRRPGPRKISSDAVFYTSNNYMVHRHDEIAFPLRAERRRVRSTEPPNVPKNRRSFHFRREKSFYFLFVLSLMSKDNNKNNNISLIIDVN